MSRINVNEETFENVTVFGQPMLFTCLRCDRTTLPKGMYMYEVRYDDEGRGDPCEIADWIMVNHWGTVIGNHPVKLNEELPSGKKCRMIDSEFDWNYEGTTSTLAEYMKLHPPQKEKEREECR